MTIFDMIKEWDDVTIEKRPNDAFRLYSDRAEELRAVVGSNATIVWLSGSNGPLFGSGSFVAIDESGEVIYNMQVIIE